MARNNSAEHTKLVKQALKRLAMMGYTAWQHNVGSGFVRSNKNSQQERWLEWGKPGHGDITIVLPPYGRHVEAEAKTGDAVQKKNQKIHQEFCIEKNGGVYFVFHDIQELFENLKKVEN